MKHAGETGVLTIAHRGGNDLDRLTKVQNAGVDMVEADVWLYRGKLEVRHEKTMGPFPVLWDRWHLMRGWVPGLLLEDLLPALRPDMGLMVDLKGRSSQLPHALVRSLGEHALKRELLICSQTWSFLDRLRGLDQPGLQLVYSAGNESMFRRLPGRLGGESRFSVAVHRRLLTADRVARLRTLATRVMTWPVNTPEDYDRFVSWGVNGVISDDPAALPPLRRAMSSGRTANV